MSNFKSEWEKESNRKTAKQQQANQDSGLCRETKYVKQYIEARDQHVEQFYLLIF